MLGELNFKIRSLTSQGSRIERHIGDEPRGRPKHVRTPWCWRAAGRHRCSGWAESACVQHRPQRVYLQRAACIVHTPARGINASTRSCSDDFGHLAAPLVARARTQLHAALVRMKQCACATLPTATLVREKANGPDARQPIRPACDRAASELSETSICTRAHARMLHARKAALV